MIDPVVLLVEELRSVEAALQKSAQTYTKDPSRENGERVNVLLQKVKRLFNELYETVPVSAPGAGQLVAIAAQHLPFAHSRHARRLHDIAERLTDGRREHSDLVWLRAMQSALMEGYCGDGGRKVAPLLNLAVLGAARPVMIFRTVQTRPEPAPWRSILAPLPN
jgi:hypothetical protein